VCVDDDVYAGEVENEPLLFLSDDLEIIGSSASFCRAFEVDPATRVELL
jgi:hypothetical protein